MRSTQMEQATGRRTFHSSAPRLKTWGWDRPSHGLTCSPLLRAPSAQDGRVKCAEFIPG